LKTEWGEIGIPKPLEETAKGITLSGEKGEGKKDPTCFRGEIKLISPSTIRNLFRKNDPGD